eukprot:scaffold85334_cov42-Phaeocystis_antarctica.AAC.3
MMLISGETPVSMYLVRVRARVRARASARVRVRARARARARVRVRARARARVRVRARLARGEGIDECRLSGEWGGCGCGEYHGPGGGLAEAGRRSGQPGARSGAGE